MITKRDLKMMKLAEKMAEHSDFGRVSIGAVLTENKDVVSVGFNQRKTHPLQRHYNHISGHHCGSWIHAEIAAYTKLPFGSNPDTLYVFRKDLEGNIAMARPCKACMRANKDYKIKRVVYTTPDGIASEDLK